MKNSLTIFLAGIILVSVVIILFIKKSDTTINSNTNTNTNTITQVPPTGVINEKKEATVPLPQETDIIRLFFEIIDEGRPSDAVNMMTQVNTSDDSTKQAWGVQFNAFKSIKLINIEPSMQSDWTENEHNYKVSLQVEMKPEAANAVPMPNYGWDNGQNTRWIQLQKINGKWMVGGIATGP